MVGGREEEEKGIAWTKGESTSSQQEGGEGKGCIEDAWE